ncbi:hypothetical protein [Frankia sp. Cas3]|uniref:hypothetical protein n=1 Tax=Frankia sp. Cas3 TaxID=3073926 RepID=UPI002AD1DDC5|nr:hypothetical protein [Frankia sp. Cas3]
MDVIGDGQVVDLAAVAAGLATRGLSVAAWEVVGWPANRGYARAHGHDGGVVGVLPLDGTTPPPAQDIVALLARVAARSDPRRSTPAPIPAGPCRWPTC